MEILLMISLLGIMLFFISEASVSTKLLFFVSMIAIILFFLFINQTSFVTKIFILVCIIERIIQLVSIVKLKKISDYKYWNLFIGFTIASFISTVLAYIVFMVLSILDETFDDAIFACFIICGYSFISNLILCIKGVNTKKIIKIENTNPKKSSFFIGLLVVLLNIIVIIFIPMLNYVNSNKTMEDTAITYLTNKYGNNDFKIITIEKNYTNNGIEYLKQ